MTTLLVGIVVVFVGGAVQACTGFGSGLIIAPCLMLILGPVAAVPTAISLSIASCFFVAVQARQHLQPRLLLPLLAGAFCGMPFGIYALSAVNPDAIKILVGLVVLCFVGAMIAGWRRPVQKQGLAIVPVGMASGFLGASTAMGGPPLILFLASQDMPKDVFRANLVAYFTVAGATVLAIFAVKGLYTREVAVTTATHIPALLLGTATGILLARHVPEERFRNVVFLGAGAMGLVLVSTGLYALLGPTLWPVS